MQKEFTPIAMRCTKEQYEAIKPKLKNVYINKDYFDIEFKSDLYLVNNWRGNNNNICSVYYPNAVTYSREVYKDWNEQIFLSACGIEIEPTYTLTKEQLKSITDPKVREWFPEVFKLQKDFTGWWCKVTCGGNEKYLVFFEKGFLSYGFDGDGNYFNDGFDSKIKDWHYEASSQEVDKAMKKEAAKRGLVKGCFFKCLRTGKIFPVTKNEPVSDKKASERVIFLNGVWSEVVTLEKGKYYTDDEGWFCFDGNFDNQGCPIGYGVNKVGEWHYKKGWQDFNGLVEMSEFQIEQALKKEALSRGFVKDAWFYDYGKNERVEFTDYRFWNNKTTKITDSCRFNMSACHNCGVIFRDGVWSKIVIPALTKTEAEAEFNIRIVD